ncbi:hypothetical protein TNCV_1201371 [Trichonephila clavipes]|nr:hypothetical protein TNCV_1201371 [Trichonephila clavipes]
MSQGPSGLRGSGVEQLAKRCPGLRHLGGGGRVLVLLNQTGSIIDLPNVNLISSKKWPQRINMGIDILVCKPSPA